jgi:myo-inositol-1(or 4)-monophosphatase
MAWKTEEIVDLLHECGNLALDIQHSAERSIKSDNTIVTEADTAIEDLIVRRLSGPEDRYFIGEETSKTYDADYHRRALEHECFVTDPVDGTVLYANHLPGWGVSVGYMNEGRLSEGAILFPVTGELIISDGDGVLYGRGSGDSFPGLEDLKPLPPPAPHAASPVITISQTIIKYGRYRGRYSALSTGSCVSAMLHIATGGSIGYLTRTRLWDLAAGMPILEKLGIRAFFDDGREFTTRVTPEFWDIPPTESRLHWRMKRHAVFCRDRETFESIIGDSEVPG